MAGLDELLSADEVTARTGLATPLVAALIPAAAPQPDRLGDIRYDVVGLLRAQVAKLLLDIGTRHDWVRYAVREDRTSDQLRESIDELRRMTSGAR